MDGTEATTTRRGTCRGCGCSVAAGARGRLPQWCKGCKKNRPNRPRKYTRTCADCSCEFTGNHARKYCDGCWARLFKTAATADCQNCGMTFKKSKQGGNAAGFFCTKKCAGQHRRKQNTMPSLLRFVDALLQREARQKRTAMRSLLNLCRRLVRSEQVNRCLCCGGSVPNPHGHDRDKFCSDSCRLTNKRAWRRAKTKPGNRKHARRAAERGLPRSHGREMLISSVGNRDGWICQLCRGVIHDTRERKGPHAPCVDHIVPLNHQANTRHGHTPDNVQIAHRKCNECKGCSVACPSLFECDNPREHIQTMQIDQTPGVAKNRSVLAAPMPRVPSARISVGFPQTGR